MVRLLLRGSPRRTVLTRPGRPMSPPAPPNANHTRASQADATSTANALSTSSTSSTPARPASPPRSPPASHQPPRCGASTPPCSGCRERGALEETARLRPEAVHHARSPRWSSTSACSTRRSTERPAARAIKSRDRLDKHGRVLHDPRRGAQAAARGQATRGPAGRRDVRGGADLRDRSRAHKIVGDQYALSTTRCCPARGRSILLARRERWTPEVEAFLRGLRPGGVPILTPLAIEPGSPVPQAQEQVHQPRGHVRGEGTTSALVRGGAGRRSWPRLLEIALPVREAVRAARRRMRGTWGTSFSRADRALRLAFPRDRNWDLDPTRRRPGPARGIQQELRRRDRGSAVRLEVGVRTEPTMLQLLQELSSTGRVYYAARLHLGDLHGRNSTTARSFTTRPRARTSRRVPATRRTSP